MIYLASRSPRRRELLKQLEVSFQILDLEIDESKLTGETPDALVKRLAVLKAETGRGLLAKVGADLVLGADTIVVLGNEVLGKPRDAAHACELLMALSGRCHRVLSAVALASSIPATTRMDRIGARYSVSQSSSLAALQSPSKARVSGQPRSSTPAAAYCSARVGSTCLAMSRATSSVSMVQQVP